MRSGSPTGQPAESGRQARARARARTRTNLYPTKSRLRARPTPTASNAFVWAPESAPNGAGCGLAWSPAATTTPPAAATLGLAPIAQPPVGVSPRSRAHTHTGRLRLAARCSALALDGRQPAAGSQVDTRERIQSKSLFLPPADLGLIYLSACV